MSDLLEEVVFNSTFKSDLSFDSSIFSLSIGSDFSRADFKGIVVMVLFLLL